MTQPALYEVLRDSGYLTHNQASFLAYELRRLFGAQASGDTASVPVPKNEDQAALMALIGENWLRENAPHRLRTPPQSSAQGAPMTDEQISNCCERINLTFEDEDFGIITRLARAVEAHHGIGHPQTPSRGGGE